MEILEKSYAPDSGRWSCGVCGIPLVQEDAFLEYARGGLHIQLARCPRCGLTFVPKSLAEGQMRDLQKRMEETCYNNSIACTKN